MTAQEQERQRAVDAREEKAPEDGEIVDFTQIETQDPIALGADVSSVLRMPKKIRVLLEKGDDQLLGLVRPQDFKKYDHNCCGEKN